MPERAFDNFDEYAEDYRSIHSNNVKLSGADSFYFARMKVEMLKSFEANERYQVLDIGCGDGATELFMTELFPRWKISAIDISEKSIEVAKKRNLPVLFSTFNGIQTSFPDQQFDIIFIAGVLHHVDFALHPNLINEIARLLKKGGRLYLFEHNPLNPVTKHLVNTCVFDKDAKLLNGKYTAKLLKAAGFTIDKKHFIIFFPRKGIFSKLIFLERFFTWLPLGGQYMIRAIRN